jgi:hypothetical protein
MKREQRNRNDRWRLAVKIVCVAIASLLFGAFTASELFALSTRFSQALGEHYFYLYPPWAIATWWSKWHTNAPALFTQPLQLGGALAVILCLAYTIHVVIRWRLCSKPVSPCLTFFVFLLEFNRHRLKAIRSLPEGE